MRILFNQGLTGEIIGLDHQGFHLKIFISYVNEDDIIHSFKVFRAFKRRLKTSHKLLLMLVEHF